MKRILALSMIFVIVMASSAFAVEEKHDYELRTVEAVSESVNTLSTDGVLSELNKNYILTSCRPQNGNRYFTAKATVSVGLGAGSVMLENHYMEQAIGA